jgi:hypothetical protein
MLHGGAGNDTVEGGTGNDTSTAAPGPTACTGGPGNDHINSARDGSIDHVSCGTGADTASIDSGDVVSSDCEHVHRCTSTRASPTRRARSSVLALALVVATQRVGETARHARRDHAVLALPERHDDCLGALAPAEVDQRPVTLVVDADRPLRLLVDAAGASSAELTRRTISGDIDRAGRRPDALAEALRGVVGYRDEHR